MTFTPTNFSEYTFKQFEKPNFQKSEYNDLIYKKHLLQTNKSKVILNYVDNNEVFISCYADSDAQTLLAKSGTEDGST